MADAAPQGWVLPEWPSLTRRPLILGLPFGAAGALMIVLTFVGVVLIRRHIPPAPRST